MLGTPIMIERNIHYVWLGDKPLPERFASFIDGWKKIFVGYNFIKWDEKTFDVESNEWVKKAIQEKNYSLAADVIRAWALLNYGGIYLDTDVEVLKSFDELVDSHDFFIGYETNCWLGCAILGAKKGHPVLKEAYSRYQQPCPNLNAKSNMRCVLNFSASLQRLYGIRLDGKKKEIPDNGIVLPRDYFFPKHYITKETKRTENSLCIHHYGAAWHSPGKELGVKIASFMVHAMGDRLFGMCFERIARANMLGQLRREYKRRVPIGVQDSNEKTNRID